MYRTHYQSKLTALLVGIIFALAAVIALLLSATPVQSPTVTAAAPAGMAQVQACNALIVALGGCK